MAITAAGKAGAADDGGSSSTIAGTNAGVAADDGAELFTAARKRARQPNSCCGLSPCRRATSDTTAPSARLSATISDFSSADHLRRRSAPVISSIRRRRAGTDTSLVSSLRSTTMVKTMPAHGPASCSPRTARGTWGPTTAYARLGSTPMPRNSYQR